MLGYPTWPPEEAPLWLLQKQVGKGAFSTVYSALDATSGKVAAVKVRTISQASHFSVRIVEACGISSTLLQVIYKHSSDNSEEICKQEVAALQHVVTITLSNVARLLGVYEVKF